MHQAFFSLCHDCLVLTDYLLTFWFFFVITAVWLCTVGSVSFGLASSVCANGRCSLPADGAQKCFAPPDWPACLQKKYDQKKRRCEEVLLKWKERRKKCFTKAALELFGIKNPLDKFSAHFLANWGDSSQLGGLGQTTSTQISSSVWRSATIGHLTIYHWNLKKSTFWCKSLGFRSTSTFKWVKFYLVSKRQKVGD